MSEQQLEQQWVPERISVQKLAKEWINARERCFSLQLALRHAEAEAAEIGSRLAESVVPKNIQIGEKISVWIRLEDHQEALLQVEAFRRLDGPGHKLQVKFRDEPSIEDRVIAAFDADRKRAD